MKTVTNAAKKILSKALEQVQQKVDLNKQVEERNAGDWLKELMETPNDRHDVSKVKYRLLWMNPGLREAPVQFGSMQEVIEAVDSDDTFDFGMTAWPLVAGCSEDVGVLAIWGPEAGVFE